MLMLELCPHMLSLGVPGGLDFNFDFDSLRYDLAF